MEIVRSGCQAVPKSENTSDEFCWRLSFSRGEQILSQNIPETAKLAFLAVKLAWKQGLKQICKKFQSYHLKTAFYHFLEEANKGDLQRAEVEMVYKSFICFMTLLLEKQSIPHFFIRSINLLEKNPMTTKEKSVCIRFFKKLQEEKMETIFCKTSRTMILIQDLRKRHYYFYMLGAIFLILANILGLCIGAAAYIIFILIALALGILFLYSLVFYIPIIIILFCSYLFVQCCKKIRIKRN